MIARLRAQLEWQPESLPEVSAASTQPDAWTGDLLVYGIFADAFEKKEGQGSCQAGQLVRSFRACSAVIPDCVGLHCGAVHRQEARDQVRGSEGAGQGIQRPHFRVRGAQ